MCKNRKCLLLALLLLCIFLLSACGKKAEPAASASAAVSSEEPADLPDEPAEPTVVNPLTGLEMDEEKINDRPVAVMLNDLKAAQPQLGVSQADIIYEVPAEGGITRMLGLFQSLDGVGNLGSIRSTRAYYLELAMGHDALLVHAGGSPEAYQDISAWDINNMDGVNGGSDAKIFWRDAQRRKTAGYEHSLLTSGENIQAYLAGGRYRLEHDDGYSYPQSFVSDGTPVNGQIAEHVALKYSPYKTATFDYDPLSKTYLVGQFGGAYVDGNSGEQVGVTNVLVLETSINVIQGDSAGRLRVDLTSGGAGQYFCGGKWIPITWSKTSRNDPFVYRTEDGTPLELGRGSSYVCIYNPKTGTLSID